MTITIGSRWKDTRGNIATILAVNNTGVRFATARSELTLGLSIFLAYYTPE